MFEDLKNHLQEAYKVAVELNRSAIAKDIELTLLKHVGVDMRSFIDKTKKTERVRSGNYKPVSVDIKKYSYKKKVNPTPVVAAKPTFEQVAGLEERNIKDAKIEEKEENIEQLIAPESIDSSIEPDDKDGNENLSELLDFQHLANQPSLLSYFGSKKDLRKYAIEKLGLKIPSRSSANKIEEIVQDELIKRIDELS
jgi:hypothetical protein